MGRRSIPAAAEPARRSASVAGPGGPFAGMPARNAAPAASRRGAGARLRARARRPAHPGSTRAPSLTGSGGGASRRAGPPGRRLAICRAPAGSGGGASRRAGLPGRPIAPLPPPLPPPAKCTSRPPNAPRTHAQYPAAPRGAAPCARGNGLARAGRRARWRAGCGRMPQRRHPPWRRPPAPEPPHIRRIPAGPRVTDRRGALKWQPAVLPL